MMNYSDWLRATGRARGRESSNEYLRYKGREAWQETGPARVTYQTEKRQKQEEQARQEKRSAAARKGWETRRRKAQEQEERRARRSAAARKGWQTRRENRAGYEEMIEDFAPSEYYAANGGTNSDEAAQNIESTIGGLLAMGYTRQQLGAAFNAMEELGDTIPRSCVYYYTGRNRRALNDWLDRFTKQVTGGRYSDFEEVRNDTSGFNLYDEDMSRERSAAEEMLDTAARVSNADNEGGFVEMPAAGPDDDILSFFN